ncbi:hypothetical protein AAFF_G00427350 [Aldrovandia affinis]|uniref:Ig-like domain-containing protein n=1 Tax=Aldrovandia affinis TaxID=143900 RepID=A0AAD7S9K5_9TELE|nr:hypothetical protein AAFF_G00427350 [Aldrovandia affinis]
MSRHGVLSRLIWFFALVAIAAGVVLQDPPSLQVAVGTSVDLHCDISGVTGRCTSLSWLLVQPETGLTFYGNPNKTTITVPGTSETADKACILRIPSTKLSDSGTFYCVVSDTRMAYHGNGTTLVVSDITMDILVPVPLDPLSQSAPVSLMCLVSGVDPSRARVHWEVEGEDMEYELPQSNVLASDSIRTRLSVPGLSWARGASVTCVLETDKGLNLNRTISRTVNVSLSGSGTPNQCIYLVAAVGGVYFLIFITTVFTMCVIWHNRRKSHPRPHAGINQSRQPQQGLERVQYASLRFGGRRREAVSHF